MIRRNHTSDPIPLSDADAIIVRQLIRFGRRPLVHVNVTDKSDPDLVAYGEHVAAMYRRGGMHACVVLHCKSWLVFQTHYYAQSSADYDVLVSSGTVKRIRLIKGGNAPIYDLAWSLRHMWVCYPVNPLRNFSRIQHLHANQMDALLEHYTGHAHLLHRLAAAKCYNKALYDTAAAAYKSLRTIVGIDEAFELTPGQASADPPMTIAVHLQYYLCTALLDALEQAAPILLLPCAPCTPLVRMQRPADPVDRHAPRVVKVPMAVSSVLARPEWPSLVKMPAVQAHMYSVFGALTERARVAVGASYRLF